MEQRELIFRAWRVKYENMTGAYSLDEIVERDFFRHEENLIWLQYTGERDIEGNRIFEGDFLEWNKLIFEVLFEDGAWTGNPSASNYAKGWFDCHMFKYAKVIGNKFEHPNLLTDER